MNKRDRKKVIYAVVFSVLVILLISVVSAGVFDWLKKLTGQATRQVEMNISVGVPQITWVRNETFDYSSGPNQADSNTNVTINFTVYCPSEFTNINRSSAKANITSTNEDLRQNTTCQWLVDFGTYYANFSCMIEFWWWDGAATWTIGTYVEDNNTNGGQNASTNFVMGTRQGFELSPGNLTWPSIAAGATNTTANNPLTLNNTGNDPITAPDIEINGTNLRGETNPVYALWAGNFSAGGQTGSNEECAIATSNATVAGLYQGLDFVNLTKGNYSVNNGIDGQEQVYLCLREAGSELTTQAYSTLNESSWTVQIS